MNHVTLISSNLHTTTPLFTQIAAGNGHAFAHIHELYRTRLLYYVKRFPLEWQEAEDLVADTFLALWRSREQLSSDEHIKNLLFLTIRNKAINLVESKKRRETLLENMPADTQTIDDSLSAEMIETEMLHLLLQAVKTLPTGCRRIFELSYDQQKNSAEIARILGMNPATVGSQKRRAIELIRDWIKKNAPAISLLLAASRFFQKFLPILCTLSSLICINY